MSCSNSLRTASIHLQLGHCAGASADAHVMAVSRSAPTNLEEESFPCSSTEGMQDGDDNDNDDEDVTHTGGTQQAAASATSLSGRMPQRPAQQPAPDLVQVQCWGTGLAGESTACCTLPAYYILPKDHF